MSLTHVGEKSKADDQLTRSDVPAENLGSIWDDFASSIGGGAF